MVRFTILKIDGMFAVHAVRAVETALGGLPGVRSLAVALGDAAIEHDEALAVETLRQAVVDAGFTISDVIEDRRQRLPLLE